MFLAARCKAQTFETAAISQVFLQQQRNSLLSNPASEFFRSQLASKLKASTKSAMKVHAVDFVSVPKRFRKIKDNLLRLLYSSLFPEIR